MARRWVDALVYSGCHKTKWLRQQKSISHSSGGWMSKTGVPALSGSGTLPPPGFQMAALMHVFIWWWESEPVCPILFLLGHQLQHEGTSFMTSFKSNYLPTVPSLTTITLRVRASTYESWRDTVYLVHSTLLLDFQNLCPSMSFLHAKYFHSIPKSPKVLAYSSINSEAWGSKSHLNIV